MGFVYVLVGIVLLFLPGFLLTFVVYPKPRQLELWQRVVGGFGLSVLISIYLGFALARINRLSTGPFLGSFTLICIALGVAAYFRGATELFSLAGRIPPARMWMRRHEGGKGNGPSETNGVRDRTND